MAYWDLRRLQQHLAKHPPAPLYLLFGEETYLHIQARNEIVKTLLTAEQMDFNYDQFFYPDTDPIKVRDAVETLPVMVPKRVVIYREAHRLKEKEWEQLYPIIFEPIDSCVFIVCIDNADKRKKYFKKLCEKAVAVELKSPYDNQVPMWVEYIGQQNQIKLNFQQCQLIHQLVGNSLSEIENELKKLKQFIGDKNVDEKDIIHVISQSRVESIFELTDAIGRCDRAAALTCLANLLSQGQNEVGAIAIIMRHLRILAQVKEGLDQGLTGTKLSVKAGVPGFFLKQYLNQSGHWHEMKIQQTIEVLHKTDVALKSSPVSSHIWLENFIIQTCS